MSTNNIFVDSKLWSMNKLTISKGNNFKFTGDQFSSLKENDALIVSNTMDFTNINIAEGC